MILSEATWGRHYTYPDELRSDVLPSTFHFSWLSWKYIYKIYSVLPFAILAKSPRCSVSGLRIQGIRTHDAELAQHSTISMNFGAKREYSTRKPEKSKQSSIGNIFIASHVTLRSHIYRYYCTYKFGLPHSFSSLPSTQLDVPSHRRVESTHVPSQHRNSDDEQDSVAIRFTVCKLESRGMKLWTKSHWGG